jgi:hypothetical protein
MHLLNNHRSRVDPAMSGSVPDDLANGGLVSSDLLHIYPHIYLPRLQWLPFLLETFFYT